MNGLIIWSTIVTLCRDGGDLEGYCMGLSLNFTTFAVYINTYMVTKGGFGFRYRQGGGQNIQEMH